MPFDNTQLRENKVIGDKTRLKMTLFLEARRQGVMVKDCLREAGISAMTLHNWKKQYPEFRMMLQEAIAQRTQIGDKATKMNFVEFRSAVLGRHTFDHMKQWVEWFESEENDHIMILCPPETAKTTLVLDYLIWRIYLDPEVRIGYASKSQPHAIKQVSKIKNILEQNKLIHQLCGNLVPGPGDPHPWRDTYFTVATRSWTPGIDEADYTCAAFGAGSQITGSRFDILIFDDPDDVNIGAADRDNIWNVILQAGETRLGTSGRMIVIGNRQGEEDVYSRIITQWQDEPDLWSVHTQSAIVSDDPENPVVIWPEKFGLPRGYKKGPIKPDGPWDQKVAWAFFDRKRRRLGSRFDLVYQNAPRSDIERDFTREMVEKALDTDHESGAWVPGSILIGVMDPAPVGGAAVLIYALLPPDKTGRRRRKVVAFEWGINWRLQGCMDRVKWYGGKYRIKYWVIDRQGGNRYFTDDPTLREIIAKQGAYFLDITTGANKDYGDFSVSSLRYLFVNDPPLLILPGRTEQDRNMTKVLREQLIDYHPGTRSPHDGPMALWYGERAIRELRLDRIKKASERASGWKHPYGATSWSGGQWSIRTPPGTISQ